MFAELAKSGVERTYKKRSDSWPASTLPSHQTVSNY